MTQPTAYSRSTGFQQEETNAVAGRSTVRTAMVDAEYDALALTISQTLANLAIIQRDDTALNDEIVTTESLSPQVKTLISTTGINPRGTWLTATAYAVKDVVETGAPVTSYICVTAHTSGTFATDRAAGKWMVLGQEPGAGTFTSITLTTGGVTLGTNNTQDLAATANRFRDGWFGRTVTAATSVVTPLLGTTTAVDLVFQANGASAWGISQIGTHTLFPSTDGTTDIGATSARVQTFFGKNVDSGTTSQISLRTNNGTTQVGVIHVATAVNTLDLFGAATTGAVGFRTNGSDANVGFVAGTKGTGSYTFNTRNDVAAKTQFQILDTAGSTRNITVTGSNGSNPILGTTAGSLLLSSAASPANGITITSGAGTQTIDVTAGTLTLPAAGGVLVTGAGGLAVTNGGNFVITTGQLNLQSGFIYVRQGTALPAGGMVVFTASTTSTFGILMGSGAPTATAQKGSLYLRSDGTGTTDRAYINTSSGSTWTALTTVA